MCSWSGRVLESCCYCFGCFLSSFQLPACCRWTTEYVCNRKPNGGRSGNSELVTCDSILCHSTELVTYLRRVPLAMSTSLQPHLTAEEIQKTRARFRQFRILVIGRANAGKTTILRKVCNTTGDPIIFDPEGNKVNYMMKVQWFMSDTDILACNLRSSRPPLIHP